MDLELFHPISPSVYRVVNGPSLCTHTVQYASMRDGADLSATSHPSLSLMARSMMWKALCFLCKNKSVSPASLNLVTISTVGVTALPFFCQARHSLHVSTIDLIRANLGSSSPAAKRMVLIFGSRACHHLKCNFLSSFITTEGLYDLRLARLTCILNLVQSGSLVAPDPVSSHTLRTRAAASDEPYGLPRLRVGDVESSSLLTSKDPELEEDAA